MNLPFWRVRGGKVETNPPWMFQFHCEDSAKRVTVLNFFPFSRKHAARTHQFGGIQWGFKLWCHVSSTKLRSLENRGIFADGIAGKFLVLVKTRSNLIALHAKQLICISVRYPAKLNCSTQKFRRKVESLPPDMHFMSPHRFNPRMQRDERYYRIKESFRGINIKKSL